MSAPSGDYDCTCCCSRIKSKACAGSDGKRSEYVNSSDCRSCQCSKHTCEDTENENHNEWVYVCSQHISYSGTYQVCQSCASKSVSHTDNTGGHQDDRSTDRIADFLEIQNACHEDYANGDTCDSVACVADFALKKHTDYSQDEYEVCNLLFPLWKGRSCVLGNCCVSGNCNRMIRQKLILNHTVKQEA